MTVFYGIQIFQMLGWGLMAAASVYYVNSIMDAEDAIKGQAYITMTYTLGSVIGAFLGRCADRFLRCQYYAPVCNDFRSSWSGDYFL